MTSKAAAPRQVASGPTPAELKAKIEAEETQREEELEGQVSALDVLLSATAIKQHEEWRLPKRDGLAADLVLTLNSLTDREFRDISTEAEEAVRGANRRSKRAGEASREINPDKFLRLIVARGVANPDFGNTDVLRRHGSITAEEVVQKVLLPGEVAKVAELIMDLSGFNDSTLEFVGNS